jgi:glycosyltransferase involved in cell wall biosynthesis
MTAVRVGFGTTLLERAAQGSKLDGIGMYVSNLHRELRAEAAVTLQPARFPRKLRLRDTAVLSKSVAFGSSYGVGAALAVTTGLPFMGSRQLERNIDIYHAPDHLIPKLRRVPVVATICDALPVKRPDWIDAGPGRFRSRLAKAAAAWADHVIAISNAMIPDLVEHLGVPEERISVVHMGIGPEWFEPVTEDGRQAVMAKYRLRPDYFLFVGTLQPRKNVETILAAYLALPKELRNRRRLVIAGQPGWDSATLIDRLRVAGDEGCTWLEYVPPGDLRALYQCAGVFVFPSLSEGFGIPVLEAFASNVPVITSNVSSLPEVAGDAALLVDPLSVRELRDAMVRLADDDGLATRLVERGRDRASRMSWKTCARNTIAVYRKLL